ncbi:hypothetical protein EON65_38665, partial [archaeon]
SLLCNLPPLPIPQMSQHKIQSNSGLTLSLRQVPKLLGQLTQSFCPDCFVVSFKLETEQRILLEKAWGAVQKYGVHLVVANLLHTRYQECQLVSREYLTGAEGVGIGVEMKELGDGSKKGGVGRMVRVEKEKGKVWLEKRIIEAVSRVHKEHMKRADMLLPSLEVEVEVEDMERVLALIQQYISRCEETWTLLSDHKQHVHHNRPAVKNVGGGWVWGVFWFTLAAIVAARISNNT